MVKSREPTEPKHGPILIFTIYIRDPINICASEFSYNQNWHLVQEKTYGLCPEIKVKKVQCFDLEVLGSVGFIKVG